MSHPTRLPVIVVTGFLGAGKTTLLRHLLLHSGQRLAVLVNEFGELGIDGALLADCGFCDAEEIGSRLVELANGCLCCTVQDEFLPTMTRLLERADQLDGILVETSGLALPEPLVAAFRWPEIRSRTRVHAVVTVVDGEALAAGHVVGDADALEAQRQADPGLEHLSAIEDLFDDQLRAADLVLVSRADCLDPAALDEVIRQLQPRLRPGTRILPLARGRIEPQLVLVTDNGDPSAAPASPDDTAGPAHAHDHHDDHDHTHVAMHAVVVQRQGDCDRIDLENRLRRLLREQPVLRLKGRFTQQGRLPLQIQAVGARLDCWFEGRIPEGEAAAPRLELVVLGAAADADRLEAACAAL